MCSEPLPFKVVSEQEPEHKIQLGTLTLSHLYFFGRRKVGRWHTLWPWCLFLGKQKRGRGAWHTSGNSWLLIDRCPSVSVVSCIRCFAYLWFIGGSERRQMSQMLGWRRVSEDARLPLTTNLQCATPGSGFHSGSHFPEQPRHGFETLPCPSEKGWVVLWSMPDSFEKKARSCFLKWPDCLAALRSGFLVASPDGQACSTGLPWEAAAMQATSPGPQVGWHMRGKVCPQVLSPPPIIPAVVLQCALDLPLLVCKHFANGSFWKTAKH